MKQEQLQLEIDMTVAGRRIVAALTRLREQQGEKVPWLKSLPSTRFLQYVVWKAGLNDPKLTRTTDGVWVQWRKPKR